GHKPAPNDHAGESPYAGPGRVAAVLDRISTSREVVREGLRRSGATVEGAGGLAALDEFTAAIGVLVETVSPAAKGGKVPLGDADDASERVRKAVAGLASQMLDAADGQLAEQADAVADKRFYATAAVLVGLLLAVGLLWLSLPGHPEAPAPAPVADPGEEYDAAAEETEPTPELIDARELLNSEELLHVGRAVRSTRGEPDDAH
ncbi:MAG: hypothetical protein ACRDT4_26925, partial [Micromonosporaceae bacterium]